MSVSEHTKKLAGNIREQISKHGVTYTDLSDLLDVASYAIDKEDDPSWGLKVTKYIKECCQYAVNGMPVSKAAFYDARRYFFYLLDQNKKM